MMLFLIWGVMACTGFFCLGYLFGQRKVLYWRIKWIEAEHDLAREQCRRPRSISDIENDTVKAFDGHCGIRRVREPEDMISGHVEYETQTLCGEATCSDECWKSWAFCPYCGKPFVDVPEQAGPLVIGLPDEVRNSETGGERWTENSTKKT
jgi:hypothetical protein